MPDDVHYLHHAALVSGRALTSQLESLTISAWPSQKPVDLTTVLLLLLLQLAVARCVVFDVSLSVFLWGVLNDCCCRCLGGVSTRPRYNLPEMHQTKPSTNRHGRTGSCKCMVMHG